MNRNSIEDQLILIITDADHDLSLLLRALQLSKYSILVVQNQLDSISFAHSLEPSLIVLDILVSESNGWEICRQLKSSQQTSYIPLLLLNSCSNTVDRVVALGWQNIDCIVSTQPTSTIVDLIQTLLSTGVKQSPQTVNFRRQQSASHHPGTKSQDSLTNKDLENFTSLVSQDLQTSLSSLTMFTDLLAKEYQDELDETAHNYLDSINNNSSRMKEWIEDLQNYARAGKSEQTWLTIDLNQVVQQVIDNLQQAITQTNTKIVVGELPQILLNPQEIYQILENLIDNAIKFNRQNPQIEIAATKQDQAWLISIADNGIGIPTSSQSEIFQVFHRLDSTDTYSGAGIGLAICSKIVERYGGKIWAKSNESGGSIFYFTLPLDICLPKTVNPATLLEESW